MAREFRLRSTCHVCVVGKEIVYFDIECGRFGKLNAAETIALSECVPGWPRMISAEGASGDRVNESRHEIFDSLIEQRILVAESEPCKDASPVAPLRPRVTLLDEYADFPVKLRVKDVLLFGMAALKAAVIARRPIAGVASYLAKRSRMIATDHASVNLDEMKRALAVFWILRPLLWSHGAQFVFERLVLLKFLSYWGIHADWIFAVSLDPSFRQYSWLQVQENVIDANSNVVATYVPIMVL